MIKITAVGMLPRPTLAESVGGILKPECEVG